MAGSSDEFNELEPLGNFDSLDSSKSDFDLSDFSFDDISLDDKDLSANIPDGKEDVQESEEDATAAFEVPGTSFGEEIPDKNTENNSNEEISLEDLAESTVDDNFEIADLSLDSFMGTELNDTEIPEDLPSELTGDMSTDTSADENTSLDDIDLPDFDTSAFETDDNNITETPSENVQEKSESSDAPSFEDGEISLDEFISQDELDAAESQIQGANGYGQEAPPAPPAPQAEAAAEDGEISLEDFLGDDFASFDSPAQKEEEVITDEPVLDIDLSFDDSVSEVPMEENDDSADSIDPSILNKQENVVTEKKDTAIGESVDLSEFGLDDESEQQITQAPAGEEEKKADEPVDIEMSVMTDSETEEDEKEEETEAAGTDETEEEISLAQDTSESEEESETSNQTTANSAPDDDFDVDELLNNIEDESAAASVKTEDISIDSFDTPAENNEVQEVKEESVKEIEEDLSSSVEENVQTPFADDFTIDIPVANSDEDDFAGLLVTEEDNVTESPVLEESAAEENVLSEESTVTEDNTAFDHSAVADESVVSVDNTFVEENSASDESAVSEDNTAFDDSVAADESMPLSAEDISVEESSPVEANSVFESAAPVEEKAADIFDSASLEANGEPVLEASVNAPADSTNAETETVTLDESPVLESSFAVENVLSEDTSMTEEDITSEESTNLSAEEPQLEEISEPVLDSNTYEENSALEENSVDIIEEKDDNINEVSESNDLTAETSMGITENMNSETVNNEAIEDQSLALMKQITSELNSLKSEITSLKSELSELKNSSVIENETPAAEKDTGFFGDSDDDDTIALSGEELSNILNTTDFVTEDSQNVTETAQENDAVSLESETISLESETIPQEDQAFSQEDESESEEVISPLSSDSENIVDAATASEEEKAQSVLNDDDLSTVQASTLESLSEPIDLFAEEDVPEPLTDESFNYLESEVKTDEISDTPISEDDESLEEGISESPVEDVFAAWKSQEEAYKREKEEEFEGWEEAQRKREAEGEIFSDTESDKTSEEVSEPSSAASEIMMPEPEEDTEEEDPDANDIALTTDELLAVTNHVIADQVADGAAVSEGAPVQVEETSAPKTETIPSEMKEEIKSVLSYMDQLLENLPEDKIAEFAQSAQFETYKKLFTELGLS
jgi:hypothetical protein